MDLFGSDSDSEQEQSESSCNDNDGNNSLHGSFSGVRLTAEARKYLEKRGEAKSNLNGGEGTATSAKERVGNAVWRESLIAANQLIEKNVEDSDLPPIFPSPAFVGPVIFQSDSSHYCGGRSFLASQDLPAGALVMKEEPMVGWDEDLMGIGGTGAFDGFIDVLVGCKRAREEEQLSLLRSSQESTELEVCDVLLCAKSLHPTSLSHVPQRQVAKVKKSHSSSISASAAKLGLDEEEVLRLYFCFLCNGFSSGLYGFLSIFNHSETPNCYKFPPSPPSHQSSVWTTRAVSKGEHLTISYFNPRCQSFDRRRRYLESHHFFDIVREAEVLKAFDVNPPGMDPALVEEYESIMDSLSSSLQAIVSLANHHSSSSSSSSSSQDTLRERRSSLSENLKPMLSLLEASSTLLLDVTHSFGKTSRNVTFLRANDLHTDICLTYLEASPSLPPSCLPSLLQSASISNALHLSHDGVHHPSYGKSCVDFADVISHTIVNSPEIITSTDFVSAKTLMEAMKLEGELRKLHERISSMYGR